MSDDCLHDADLYYKEALDVHECIDCGEYFKIHELLSQSSERRELKQVIAEWKLVYGYDRMEKKEAALLSEDSRLRDLLKQAFEYLEFHWDEGPEHEGWQSDKLSKLCADINAAVSGRRDG